MSRQTVCGMLFILLLVSMTTSAFNLRSAKASEIIYIRYDGSVDPPTAPIQHDGDFYILTGNIISDTNGIIIQKDDMMLDGAGHAVQGTGSGIGIQVSERNNVTIKNVEINGFTQGIWLAHSSNIIISKNDLANNRFSIYILNSSDNTVCQNTVKDSHYSVYLYGASNNNNVISKNTMTENNDNGIWIYGNSCYNLIYKNRIANCLLYGIFIRDHASDNTVSGNNVTACINGDGIKMLWDADKNKIYGNSVMKSAFGITIESSSNNALRNNRISENGVNFAVSGEELSHFIQDIDASNTVNGKPVYYLINEEGMVINQPNYANVGYLAVINSTNMVVQDLHVENNNTQGILFVNTTNSLIQNATVKGNSYGISLQWSSNNSIVENNLVSNFNAGLHFYCSANNNISSNYEAGSNFGFMLEDSDGNRVTRNTVTNTGYGIDLSGSSNNSIVGNNLTNNWAGIRFANSSSYNRIYHNNFINNTRQVFTWLSTVNIWDNGYLSGGNYWSDYNGTDFYRGSYQNEAGSDGIVDKPYMIDKNNTDSYALMKPYAGSHDIGIKVSISKPAIPEGYNTTATVHLKVINYGEQAETFSLTFSIGATTEEQPITLAERNSTILTFTWNSTGYHNGNYTINAYATPILGETDTADNVYMGWILITKSGDIGGGLPPQFFKCDGKVDSKDLALFLMCYKGTAPPEAMYLADLGGEVPPKFFKCDGKLDSKDLALFLRCYKGLGPDT